MIARPLDLASKLRSEPRNFDYVFFIDLGAIVLFFMLFGSRFVLAPGLGVDFKIPVLPGAVETASATTHYISVKRGGQVFAGDGLLNRAQLRAWLKAQAATTPHPVLLVRVNEDVPMSDWTEINHAAQEAGFERVLWGAEAPPESLETLRR